MDHPSGASVPSRPQNILNITIRYTASIPDLLLDVPNGEDTSVAALKQLMRQELDEANSKNRLRLIHNGKLLKDGDLLSAVLKLPSTPPRAVDLKGKGKGVGPLPPRVYINCAISDPLTPAELKAEAHIAANILSQSKRTTTKEGNAGSSNNTTAPAPRGFDRLLAGGFTPAEVNQLRLQFLSIQSNIHTPDAMPSQETLRQMEDAWIDDNAGGAGSSGGGFDFGDDGLGGGALDDLLWGNIMGFLWPLGCMGWAIREEGVWSKRRRVAVFTGFMLSLSFGALRVIG